MRSTATGTWRSAPAAWGTAYGIIRLTARDSPRVWTHLFVLSLPPDEAAWVVDTGADVIVPAPGTGTQIAELDIVGR